MINTLRVLVSWKCNLKCSYCCNEQPQFRNGIRPVKLDEIDWDKYENFCISGGEPLLNMPLVRQICARIPFSHDGPTAILYTNGTLMTEELARELADLGIRFINVGLHHPNSFTPIIQRVTKATRHLPLGVRFHAQDIYEVELIRRHLVSFRFWKMNDCDRDNEDRVVLI